MEALTAFLQVLNNLSPLAVIGLLGTVIFLMVRGKTSADAKMETIATNHLHDLPGMREDLQAIGETLKRVESTLQRMEVKLGEDFSYLKARVAGLK